MTLACIFTILSLVLCVLQIILRKKVNLITLCRVSVFLPLLAVLIKAAADWGKACAAMSAAHGLPEGAMTSRHAAMLNMLSVGFLFTLGLLIVYAVTKVVFDNTKPKSSQIQS
ncbi:MAG: hypothetical protein U5R06_11190 [candidate division KSB1 bacterium]|nr:hypothetical protein [candidate division KSB1 bacterium]